MARLRNWWRSEERTNGDVILAGLAVLIIFAALSALAGCGKSGSEGLVGLVVSESACPVVPGGCSVGGEPGPGRQAPARSSAAMRMML